MLLRQMMKIEKYRLAYPYKESVNNKGIPGNATASWDQVGTKLGLSQTDIEAILNFCILERSLTDIMNIIGRSNRTKFRNKYISSLIGEGLLAMTASDKPNSRLQKYYTTEKGKSFLHSI